VNTIEFDCTASEKVAVAVVLVGTLMAPLFGVWAVTVGAVVSATVVNDHVVADVIALPAKSVADTLAVYTVFSAKALLGVNVAVFVLEL
jgi:hypothetical protein